MPADTETSFQRAMRIADERKAQQWRAYRERDPLPKAAFVDYELTLAPVIRVVGEARFTKYIRVYDSDKIQRPTEQAAFALARGDKWRDGLVVVRQEPRGETRYCYGCKTRHPLSDFDRDKRTASGLAFYCRRARRDMERQVYRRAS